MLNLAERVYLQSPVWAQLGMVAAYGWWWNRRRFGKHFRTLLSEFRARERWSAEQFEVYQERRLRTVFAAARNSPYYRRIFAEAKIDERMKPREVLARLPLLSKEVLRTRAGELVTENPSPRGTVIMKSSGTTGTPTAIHYTPGFHALEVALQEARGRNWAGVTYQQRRVMFGVRKVCRFDQEKPPFWRFSPAEDMAYASIYHLSPKFLPSYLRFLRKYKPAVIMGYPSALNAVAQYALENNDLPAPAQAVFTSSETLTMKAREAIEAAWQSRVYDQYGAVEGCVFASQCEQGRYHLSPEVGIVEILDLQGRPCSRGETGEVVCTGLQNTLQPLLRYVIGDVARWSIVQSCPCGREMPVLEALEGRFEDLCYTPDGRQVLRFDTVFKGVAGIKEAQVVQEKIDVFTIYVEPTSSFSRHEVARIKQNMLLHVGDVETSVQAVPAIERNSSGKFRAVVCKLSHDERKRFTRELRRGNTPPQEMRQSSFISHS